MIILYLKSINKIIRDPEPKVFEELGYDDLLWIDLVVPTAKERKLVENFLDITLLTRQQAEEIETSSRYSELEDSIICNTSFTILREGGFEVETVSFILSAGLLVYERYFQRSQPQDTDELPVLYHRLSRTDFDPRSPYRPRRRHGRNHLAPHRRPQCRQ